MSLAVLVQHRFPEARLDRCTYAVWAFLLMSHDCHTDSDSSRPVVGGLLDDCDEGERRVWKPEWI